MRIASQVSWKFRFMWQARLALLEGVRDMFSPSSSAFDASRWLEDAKNFFATATRVVALFNCATSVKRPLQSSETRGQLIKRARAMCEQAAETNGCTFKAPARLLLAVKKVVQQDPSESIHAVSLPDDAAASLHSWRCWCRNELPQFCPECFGLIVCSPKWGPNVVLYLSLSRSLRGARCPVRRQ